MEQIFDLLYEERNNPKSYLSFLPKDIINVCLQYTAENIKRERNKWLKDSMDIQYLKAIRRIEITEGVRFPIVPVLDMATKNWEDRWMSKTYWEWNKWYRPKNIPRPYKIYNGMWVWNFADTQQFWIDVTYHFIIYDNPTDSNPKLFALDSFTNTYIYLNRFLQDKDPRWLDNLSRWKDKYAF